MTKRSRFTSGFAKIEKSLGNVMSVVQHPPALKREPASGFALPNKLACGHTAFHHKSRGLGSLNAVCLSG
eukprot:1350947-Pleurochrysis_carterae.AAC.2